MSAKYPDTKRQEKRTRTTSLHLRDVLLVQPKLLVDAEYILADGECRRAVHVMRDDAEQLGAIPGRERLPPRLRAA